MARTTLPMRSTAKSPALNPAGVIPTAEQAQAKLASIGAAFSHWLRSLTYIPEGNRDIRLDFLRGFSLFVIIANHIGYYPAYTIYFTGGGYFLVSAAESFIFISGLVMGMVYGAKIAKYGLKLATEKIWNRARELYLWNFIVAMLYLAIAYLTPLATRREEVAAPPAFNLELVFKVLTLQQSFGWSDLLATYAVLVAIAPVIFFLLIKKMGWLVSLASWGLWVGYQVAPQHFSFTLGTFPILAWQVLFVQGLLIGYYREQIKEFFGKFPRWTLYLPLAGIAIGLVAFGIAWVYGGVFSGNSQLTSEFEWYFSKLDLRPGRVISFGIIFAAIFLLVTHFWQLLNRALGWLFNPMGQNSLYVYILHGFVVSIFFNLPNYGEANAMVHTLGHVSAVLVLWLLVKNKVLFNVIPR